MTKDGTSHKLAIQSCTDKDSGLYRFVSGEQSTQGKVTIGGMIYVPPLIAAHIGNYCSSSLN